MTIGLATEILREYGPPLLQSGGQDQLRKQYFSEQRAHLQEDGVQAHLIPFFRDLSVSFAALGVCGYRSEKQKWQFM